MIIVVGHRVYIYVCVCVCVSVVICVWVLSFVGVGYAYKSDRDRNDNPLCVLHCQPLIPVLATPGDTQGANTEVSHYNDFIMGAIASQITSLTIVFSTVYLDTDQRKHQSSASLAFVRGIHRRPVNSLAQMASNAENGSTWWRHHEWLAHCTCIHCLRFITHFARGDHSHLIVKHYSDVIMSTTSSQITGVWIICSTVCSGADQRKYQSSDTLAFVRGICGDRCVPLTKGQ